MNWVESVIVVVGSAVVAGLLTGCLILIDRLVVSHQRKRYNPR